MPYPQTDIEFTGKLCDLMREAASVLLLEISSQLISNPAIFCTARYESLISAAAEVYFPVFEPNSA